MHPSTCWPCFLPHLPAIPLTPPSSLSAPYQHLHGWTTPWPPGSLPFFSLPPSASLSSLLPQATPLLQSHPAFRDKENTEDQFCSVTFGGGLQSEGMAGEAELKEIYLGCRREREEISAPASSQEVKGGETERRREEKRRKEKLTIFWTGDCLMLGQMRGDKRRGMAWREK